MGGAAVVDEESALRGCYTLADSLGHRIQLFGRPDVFCVGCGMTFGGGPGRVVELEKVRPHLVEVAADALVERAELTPAGRAVLVRLAPSFVGTLAELVATVQAICAPP
jgi:hypothetical protein